MMSSLLMSSLHSNWTLLIDGRSASGKSSLALRLRDEISNDIGSLVQLIRLDDCYPGWSGLSAGANHIIDRVLSPRAAGQNGTWHRWDWPANAPAEAHQVSATTPLIVEGCGILTAASAKLCSWSLWMDADADTRYARAIARDGNAYKPYWQMWADQELEHIRVEHPQQLAHQVIMTDGWPAK